MKKGAAVAAVAIFSLAVSVCAEAVYTQGRTAALNSGEYLPQLTELNSQVLSAQKGYLSDSSEEASAFTSLYSDRLGLVQEYNDLVEVQSSELKIKLIDYDVALKKLKFKIDDYYSLKADAQAAENEYKLGNAEYKDFQTVQKSCEELYYSIKSDLFDISVMKADIENITRQKLSDSFNFESLYFITDALRLDVSSYTDMSDFDTICHPVDFTSEPDKPVDCTEQLNTSIRLYYALGDLMREYISTSTEIKQLKEDIKLGYADSSALKEAQTACNTAYLAAYEGKAEYAKSLIALDDALGNAIISPLAMSGELSRTYTSMLPQEISGAGLWQIRSSGNSRVFVPTISPEEIFVDKDYDYYYIITYNGKQIGRANARSGCKLSAAEYSSDAPYAVITYYLGSAEAGSYKLDVFSPVGAFVN